jgi:hypothetical protein
VKVIYIAGPFRAPSKHCPGHQDHWGIQQNIMRAMECALDVWRLGAVALCPHGNTFCLQHAAPDEVWLEGDLELLSRCDAVFMVPGWETSQGAKAERAHAISKDLPVFYGIDDIQEWLECERTCAVA